MPKPNLTLNNTFRLISDTPTELVAEILVCACGDYFDVDNPFANDAVHNTLFIRRRSAFRRVSVSWCQIIDHTSAFWASHVFTPLQGRSAFRFMSEKLSGAALHLRLVLRGPTAGEPYTRDGQIGLHAVVDVLRSKSEQCATLGIFFNGRAVFESIAGQLASSRFPRLTQVALINIEPVWTTDRADKLLPTPQFINLGGPTMRHLRLVGFGLSMQNNICFRHVAILVLGNLDGTTAPTMDQLYRMLLEATWLEALSVGRMDRTGECLNNGLKGV
jgi:hypothetical protein